MTEQDKNWSAKVTRESHALDLEEGADDDVLIMPEHIAAMEPLLSDLEVHMLRRCGHWSQQEKPDEVNRLIVDWLVQRR